MPVDPRMILELTNDPGEIHAMFMGFVAGVWKHDLNSSWQRDMSRAPEISNEYARYKTFYVLGNRLKYVLPATGGGALLTSPVCQNVLSAVL